MEEYEGHRIKELEARLKKVERRSVYIRNSLIFMGFMFLLAAFVNWLSPRTIVANRILLEDSFSQAGIDMYVQPNPSIVLRDRAGERRGIFYLYQGNSMLDFYDSQGRIKSRVSVTDDKPAVTFYGFEGEMRTLFMIQNNGRTDYEDKPMFTFVGKEGEVRANVLIEETTSGLRLIDSVGEEITTFSFLE